LAIVIGVYVGVKGKSWEVVPDYNQPKIIGTAQGQCNKNCGKASPSRNKEHPQTLSTLEMEKSENNLQPTYAGGIVFRVHRGGMGLEEGKRLAHACRIRPLLQKGVPAATTRQPSGTGETSNSSKMIDFE